MRIKMIVLMLVAIGCLTMGRALRPFDVDLNQQSSVRFRHFWVSTGFSPNSSSSLQVKSYLLSKETHMNLGYISAIPNHGIRYIRIHWLLSLVSTKMFYRSSRLHYNYLYLDKMISRILAEGLLPSFELMGIPNVRRNNFNHEIPWKRLCYHIASRYIEKYGLENVKKWRFEAWNEPDSPMYNVLNYTINEYLNYVTECITGLKGASSLLYVGGPGGVMKTNHLYSKAFLKYCNKHEKLCQLDYISYHKKSFPKDISKDALSFKARIESDYKNLSSLPLYNDESDTLSGWWKPESWRGDVRYPAAMCNTIYYLLNVLDQINLRGISFDNAFLNQYPSFFDQRTLLTRFYINNGTDESLQFIRKPAYMVMGMLSILGNYLMETKSVENSSRFHFIVTKDHQNLTRSAILFVLAKHNMTKSEKYYKLKVNILLPVQWKNATYAFYLLDNKLPHPQAEWIRLGSPEMPNQKERKIMRQSEGPHRIFFGNVSEVLIINANIGKPSVGLINICSPTTASPGKVTHLRVMNITSNEVLILWKDGKVHSRCIKTYIIEYRPLNLRSKFKKINGEDIIMCSFQFVRSKKYNTQGLYRVAALDYFDRMGPYSEVLKYA